jgi:hypothetical protein
MRQALAKGMQGEVVVLGLLSSAKSELNFTSSSVPEASSLE